ncbi:MAG: hypothetical protein RR738_01840 [Anaerorhabdus sp.]|uniref:hypothetical protein n=1 Tax=Anaerorhabdus sp. TaxID=1872524 RepID=UPI002FCBB620
MGLIVSPIALYTTVMFCKSNVIIGIILEIIFLVYYVGNNWKFIKTIIDKIEELLYKSMTW